MASDSLADLPEQRAVIDWLKSVRNSGGIARYPGGLDTFQQDLLQRLDHLPVRVPNQASDAVTLLYSGPLGNTDSWQVAESLGKKSQGQVVTIGQTPAGQLQNSIVFKRAIDDVGGRSHPNIFDQLSETRTVDGRKIESIWDRASARLAHAAEGDVRTLTPSALDSKVFAKVELPALLDNPKVSHVNGVPVEAYREIYASTPGSVENKLSRVNMAVQASSYDLTREMRWRQTTDARTGRLVVDAVDAGQLFEGTPHRPAVTLAANDASFVMSRGDPSMTPEQLARMNEGRAQMHGALETVGARPGMTADAVPPRIRTATVLKGLGVAGTAYGVYEGYGELRDALDGARSNREWHVRGGEASVDLATRATITGTAAVGGGALGGAGGSLVAPGPGTLTGVVVGGGASAYAAERAYEDSRVQQWARAIGAAGGELSYDHFSREGRLLRRVEGLQAELAQAGSEAERQRIGQQLQTVGDEFKLEVDRNNRYFQGRELIDQQWPALGEQFPGLKQSQVVKAYEARLEQGVDDPSRAVQGAFSDAVHDKVQARGLPYVPSTDYAAYGDQALNQAWTRFNGQREQGEAAIADLQQRGPQRESVPLVGDWLGRRSHDVQMQRAQNAHWQDDGHVRAIEGEMRSRGLPVPGGARETGHESVREPVAGLDPHSQRLLQDSEREVAELARQHGLGWNEGLANTSAAVAASARAAGLERVSLLSASQGKIHIGHFDGTWLKETTLDARVAANTPAEQSVRRLAEPEQSPTQAVQAGTLVAQTEPLAVGRSL